jgi:hypothetical protein
MVLAFAPFDISAPRRKFKSDDEQSQQPPNEEYRYEGADDMANPLAGCVWSAESEHPGRIALPHQATFGHRNVYNASAALVGGNSLRISLGSLPRARHGLLLRPRSTPSRIMEN